MAPRKKLSKPIQKRRASSQTDRQQKSLSPGDWFEKLVAIQKWLRDPGGCPWDREQTHQTLRTYLIEEAYEVLDALEAASKPGVATWELNEIAAVKLKQLKAEPAFLNYGHPPYPAVVCTSVNHVVVHGVPRRDVILKEGDILSIDFGAFKAGWCGDSARTVPIGPVTPAAKALMDATRESLDRAIAAAETAVERGGTPMALRARADIAKARGDRARALADFETLAAAVDDAGVRLELAKLYESVISE